MPRTIRIENAAGPRFWYQCSTTTMTADVPGGGTKQPPPYSLTNITQAGDLTNVLSLPDVLPPLDGARNPALLVTVDNEEKDSLLSRSDPFVAHQLQELLATTNVSFLKLTTEQSAVEENLHDSAVSSLVPLLKSVLQLDRYALDKDEAVNISGVGGAAASASGSGAVRHDSDAAAIGVDMRTPSKRMRTQGSEGTFLWASVPTPEQSGQLAATPQSVGTEVRIQQEELEACANDLAAVSTPAAESLENVLESPNVLRGRKLAETRPHNDLSIDNASDPASVERFKDFLDGLIIEHDQCDQDIYVLNDLQLRKIRYEVALYRSSFSFEAIDPSLMLRFLDILVVQIGQSSGTSYAAFASTDDASQADKQQQLHRSIAAAAVILSIFLDTKLPSECRSEEAMEAVVDVILLTLQKCVYPLLDESVMAAATKESSSMEVEEENTPTGDGDGADLTTGISPQKGMTRGERNAKKRAQVKKKREQQEHTARLKTVISSVTDLLRHFGDLVRVTRVVERFVIRMLEVSINAFFIENANPLQHAALHIVTSVFSYYPQCRSMVMDDILSAVVKIPISKRYLRSYIVDGIEPGDHAVHTTVIQVFTALVLELLQSCVTAPADDSEDASGTATPAKELESAITRRTRRSSTAATEEDDDAQMDSDLEGDEPDSSDPLLQVHARFVTECTNFVSVFVTRCASKSSEHDYRPIIENFVQDLLAVFAYPQFPAANTLLSLLCKQFCANLTTESASKNEHQRNIRALSLEMLGTMGRCLLQKKREATHFIPTNFHFIFTNDKDVAGAEKPLPKATSGAGPFRQPSSQGQFMIDCDHCHFWFRADRLESHQTPVDPLHPPARWVCAHCRYFTAVMERVQELCPDINFEGLDDELVSAFLIDFVVLMHLRAGQQTSLESALDNARQCFLVMRYADCTQSNTSALADLARRLHDEPALIPVPSTSLSFLTAHPAQPPFLCDFYMWTLTVMGQVSVFSSTDSVLRYVLLEMKQPSSLQRSKSMKALKGFVEADSAVADTEYVQRAIRDRLLDPSTQVRLAAVDLAGIALFTPYRKASGAAPALSDEFHTGYLNDVLGRIKDTGVSVRKKVISILGEFCENVTLIIRRAYHSSHSTNSDPHTLPPADSNSDSGSPSPEAETGAEEDPSAPLLGISAVTTKICCHLAGRVDDETSIRSMVLTTLCKLWFLDPIRASLGNGGGVVGNKPQSTGATRQLNAALDRAEWRRRAQQIAHVVQLTCPNISKSVDLTKARWLVRLVHYAVENPSVILDPKEIRAHRIGHTIRDNMDDDDEEYDVVAELVNERCLKLIDVLVDELTQATDDDYIASCCACLSLFAQASPVLLEKYLIQLETLLRHQESFPVLFHITTVFLAVSGCISHSQVLLGSSVLRQQLSSSHMSHSLFTNVVQDMSEIIFRPRMDLSVLHSCAKLLCVVVQQHSRSTDLIWRNLCLFYSQLKENYPSASALSADMSDGMRLQLLKTLRYLLLIGLFCRHFPFDSQRQQGEIPSEVSAIVNAVFSEEQSILQQVYGMVCKYARHSDSRICKQGILSLSNLMIRAPQFALESRDLFSWALKPSQETSITVQLLRGLYDFLAAEEHSIEVAHLENVGKGDDDDDNADADENAPTEADGDTATPHGRRTPSAPTKPSDSGLSSAVVQQYLPDVLALMQMTNVGVRYSALQFVAKSLSLGLAHPLYCVGPLVAAQMDAEELVRERSFQTLLELHKKDSAMISTRLKNGLRIAFARVRSFVDDAKPAEMMTRLYILIRQNRAQRMRMFSSILEDMVQWLAEAERSAPVENADADEQDADGKLQYYAFVCRVIADLPYGMADEIMHLIYAVNEKVNLYGSALMADLEKALVGYAHTRIGNHTEHADVVNDDNGDDDDDDEISGNGADSNSDDDLAGGVGVGMSAKQQRALKDCGEGASLAIAQKGRAAAAVSLLLLLKRYLKAEYGLTDDRCRDYSPYQHVGDRPVQKFHGDGMFSVLSQNVPVMGKHALTIADCYAQYQAFRRLIHEDTDDFTFSSRRRSGGSRSRRTTTDDSAIADADSDTATPDTAASAKSKGRSTGRSRRTKATSSTKKKKTRKRLSYAKMGDSDGEGDDDSGDEDFVA